MKLFNMYIENSNMEEYIKVPKYYLTITAIWPLGKSKWAWLYYLHSFVISYLLIFLFTTSAGIDIYLSLISSNWEKLADGIYFFMTEITFLIKFTLFTSRRNQWKKILDIFEDPVFYSHLPDQQKYIDKWGKFTSTYSQAFIVTCMCSVFFYAIYPVLDNNEDIILPFRSWYPFDVKNNLYLRSIVYVLQLLSLLISIWINGSLDLLPCICTNICCAQIEIMKDSLELVTERAQKKFKNDQMKQETDKNSCLLLNAEQDKYVSATLKKCVIHHKAIVSLLKSAEDIFTTGMFIQFMTSVVAICATLFQMIVVSMQSLKFFTMISYMGAVLFEISIYCFNGNEVIVQSSSIADSCYKMEWYRCSTKVKKSIFIIMERCKRPMYMSAGGFFILSIITLTTLLRTAYSYFAVLRRVYTD